MKLMRMGEAGEEKPAILDETGVIRDLSQHVDDITGAFLNDAALSKLRAIDLSDLPEMDPATRIAPCLGGVQNFLAIGLNYSDHAAETGATPPAEPMLFSKSTRSIAGANDPIILPRGSVSTDWEVEVGIVIGKTAQYISENAARDHIAGFCLINDVSERDFQKKRAGQFIKGKSADSFGPIGPWLVTRDEIPDPQALALYTEVNGHRYQDGNSKDMIFGCDHIVAYLSQFMTLAPGDIIATGTPAGVGLGIKPSPIFLKAGDHVQLGVAGLGVQRHDVIDA